MAKAYFTQNKRIGSVGGSVYSVVKGQCIERAKPVSVANPRTDAQMTQRTQFLSAVRFFQRAIQRFFKFAFEGKKSVESDYNVFMRLNAKVGGFLTKAQSDAVSFPIIAPFTISQGSLVAPVYGLDSILHGTSNYSQMVLGSAPEGATAFTTIAQVSANILATYPAYRAGDIITIVSLYSSATGEFWNDLDAVRFVGTGEEIRWDIQQIILDTTNDMTLAEAGLSCSIADGKYILEKEIGPRPVLCGCAVVVSRNEASGLKVSNARISLSPSADSAYNEMRDAAHLEQVLAWWGAQQQAILQGSIATADNQANELKVLYVGDDPEIQLSSIELMQGLTEGSNIVFSGDASRVNLSDFSSDGESNWMWGLKHYDYNKEKVSLEFSVYSNATPGTYKLYYKGQHFVNVLILQRS